MNDPWYLVVAQRFFWGCVIGGVLLFVLILALALGW